MGRAAQGVDDPAVEVFERGPRGFGDVGDIGQIGQVPHTEAEAMDIAVFHLEGGQADRAARAVDLDIPVDGTEVQDRRIGRARRLHEGIAEARQKVVLRRPVCPDMNALAHVEHDHAQVVDAVHVIGMGMGIDHALQLAHIRIQQLRAQVGRGVDQHTGHAMRCFALDQQRAAPPTVARLVRVAIAPVAAKAGHAARRSAAQDDEAQLCHQAACLHVLAFQNRRSKLAVVWAKNAASDSPKVSAARRAVCSV